MEKIVVDPRFRGNIVTTLNDVERKLHCVDIWSIGMTFLYILTAELDSLIKLKKNEILTILYKKNQHIQCNKSFISFLIDVLEDDYESRPKL
jgi:hypothetical protein